MGTFRIVIEAVGGHGVDREAKDGEKVNFQKEGENTPDAIAKKCADSLKANHYTVNSAVLIHWPGQDGEVTDDLVTGVRKGNF